MKELNFWENHLQEEPICNQFISNWQSIKTEVLCLREKFPNFFGSYPKFKVTDLKTHKKIKLYENDWIVSPFSKFDEKYNEVNSVEKHVGSDLEKMIARYRKRVIPTIHNIISEPEDLGILANVFVSVLSPGTIINPHQGYSKEYMRIHLGLISDPECKITVGEETKTWEEGKILAFKDGGPYYHSVVHNGTNDRYILSFDLKLDYLKNYIKIV